MIFRIDDWENRKAGFIKFIEHERTEEFFFADKNHVFFLDHNIRDGFRAKTHNCGEAFAVFKTQDGLWSALDDANEIFERIRRIFRNFDSRLRLTIFFELRVNKLYEFSPKFFPHVIMNYSI